MGTYKRVDVTDEDVFDGFSFKDMDGDEYWVDTSDENAMASLGRNSDVAFPFYWADIPMFIKMLEAAYKHCKEQS